MQAMAVPGVVSATYNLSPDLGRPGSIHDLFLPRQVSLACNVGQPEEESDKDEEVEFFGRRASVFPQEIIDQIIDYNYDGIPSLQAASLAPHSFLPSFGVHPFAEVIFVHEHVLGPVPEMFVVQDITGRLSTCRDFLSLLLEAPWISSVVKTLVLHNRDEVHSVNGILSNVPGQSWKALSADLRATFITTLPRLSQLDVDFLSFEDAAEFIEVIREAKLLRHFSYVNTSGINS
ncbi:uncharacterized protein BT62DRAFT_1011521 [Guyanagaster necrorhizus]|uniref:Uncharacterized protein n=1 Tax=Guyanagaster necrorhizus TaxID=856835 RepID=A0A9P8AN87_9AGAR|nr:uncharacterized protein BT62DRAFT_1011521 [Guyanagaster necrorhizus MCA 3950]KAG7441501.1 hypothetical protein BT62DRAFT_1011521 [Guyanagaster necrorhizus MCA 3950]